MSQRSEQIANLLKGFSKESMPIFTAIVTDVDEDQMICDVEPDGQAELDEVRLKAGIDGIKDGIVEFPKIGSTVLCGIIGNDEDICFIIKCSEVEKVVINGGLKGGLINIETLVQELQKASERIDKIVEAINTGSPSPQDGGAAVITAIRGELASIGETEDFTNMEDDKVTH